MSRRRLATPRITKELRHETNPSSRDIRGRVSALPMRPKEWVMPCPKPQLRAGVQLDMARVAVGKAAPSLKPRPRRSKNNETNPPVAPVNIVQRSEERRV